MIRAIGLVLVFIALPLLAGSAGGSFHEPVVKVPDRVYALVMNGVGFNGFTYPDTPLLEAFVGESVHFAVTVPSTAETHTFHMHGHPWFVESQGRMFDTWLLRAGDTHRFTVTAGGVDKNAGDWMYHCHISTHMESGMWGIFRVYAFAVRVGDLAPSFTVNLDRLGVPLDDATIKLTVGDDIVSALARPQGHGAYLITPVEVLPTAGVLVVTATHPDFGESVARLDLAGGPAPVPSIASQGAAVHAHE